MVTGDMLLLTSGALIVLLSLGRSPSWLLIFTLISGNESSVSADTIDDELPTETLTVVSVETCCESPLIPLMAGNKVVEVTIFGFVV